MIIFLLFGMLPLLEIAGFVVIGGEMGVGNSILWVIFDVFAGVYLLLSMGRTTLIQANHSVEKDVYPLKEIFDAICILVGSLLLMFPGFVSDALALLFLMPWLRAGIFAFLKWQNESVLEEFTKKGQGFADRYYEHESVTTKVIEGDFTVVKDDQKNEDLH